MQYKLEEGYPKNIKDIETLSRQVDGFNENVLVHSLKNRPLILCCYAYDNNQLVGYKIGFSPKPARFESWIGCIHPNYRKQGIATKLLKMQHTWCKSKKFRFIETITSNDNLAMQILNLKSELKVIGVFIDKCNEVKLRFQKELKQESQ